MEILREKLKIKLYNNFLHEAMVLRKYPEDCNERGMKQYIITSEQTKTKEAVAAVAAGK